MTALWIALPLLWPAAGVASAYAEGREWITDCTTVAMSFGTVAVWIGGPVRTYYFAACREGERLGRRHAASD